MLLGELHGILGVLGRNDLTTTCFQFCPQIECDDWLAFQQ